MAISFENQSVSTAEDYSDSDFTFSNETNFFEDISEMNHDWNFMSNLGKTTFVILCIVMSVGIPANVMLILVSERVYALIPYNLFGISYKKVVTAKNVRLQMEYMV